MCNSEIPVEEMSDLHLELGGDAEGRLPSQSYAKVVSREGDTFTIRFTAGDPASAIARSVPKDQP